MAGFVLELRFFRSAAGNEPVREWLKALGRPQMKVIGEDALHVQRHWPISKPLVDGLGGGLHELRSTVMRKEYRVFFYINDSVMVLLHGYQKKTQKAPATEVALARKRMKEDSDG
jgi:phage-related protein